jgi:transmembrane sensor
LFPRLYRYIIDLMENVKSKYGEFSAEDFALDERFQKWVLTPDKETEQFWNDLLLHFPQKQKEINEAKELVQLSGLVPDPEANTAYLATWNKLRQNTLASGIPASRFVRARYPMIAATLAGLLVVSYFLLTREQPAELLTFQSKFGETKQVTLSDGSKVMLNSNSDLRYLNDFKSDRKVFLKGEAFFEVSHLNNNQKFIVSVADDVDVEVTGTEFNVNARRNNIEVFLQSGKVNVNATSATVELHPGEKATFNRDSKDLAKTTATAKEIEHLLGWKNEVFIYNDDLLTTIAEDVHNHYGLEVVITDSTLASRRFTGRIPSQPIDVMLKVLSETLEINIQRKPGQIIIEPLRN